MPKRTHERGPSLSLRPYKTSRSFQDENLLQDEGMTMDGDTYSGGIIPQQSESVWEKLQMISTSEPLIVPPLNFLGGLVRPLTTFDISGITAWPSSLGVFKKEFRYNLTPQLGRQLPLDVLELTVLRTMGGILIPNSSSPLPTPLYLHLGFATWLNIDVFVVLPQLPQQACEDGNLSRLQEVVLEAWTDRIFLPAMYDGDARSPSSWRMSKLNRFSTLWYNAKVANFPTYKILTGEKLAEIWTKIVRNSEAIPEFRNPFLVMHMDKRQSGMFKGHNPEVVFEAFQEAFKEEIDISYVGLTGDTLKISISCDVVV